MATSTSTHSALLRCGAVPFRSAGARLGASHEAASQGTAIIPAAVGVACARMGNVGEERDTRSRVGT